MFAWLTGDYLPSNFSFISLDQLRDMFIFLGIGFIALSLVFVQMYRYAIRLKDELLLSEFEVFVSRTLMIMWSGAAVIGLICVVLAIILPRQFVPFSGFALMLLWPWFPLVRARRGRTAPGA
jgi:hypothetical protein